MSSPPDALRAEAPADRSGVRAEARSGEPAAAHSGKAAVWAALPERARSVLALYLRGLPLPDIARELALSEGEILTILESAPARRYIELRLREAENELQHLLPSAIDAVRAGLSHLEPEVRLRAADQFWKLTGRYKQDAGSARVSAEDVVQQLLVQVNIHTQQEKPDAPDRS